MRSRDIRQHTSNFCSRRSGENLIRLGSHWGRHSARICCSDCVLSAKDMLHPTIGTPEIRSSRDQWYQHERNNLNTANLLLGTSKHIRNLRQVPSSSSLNGETFSIDSRMTWSAIPKYPHYQLPFRQHWVGTNQVTLAGRYVYIQFTLFNLLV